jgi:hypothetical protein
MFLSWFHVSFDGIYRRWFSPLQRAMSVGMGSRSFFSSENDDDDGGERDIERERRKKGGRDNVLA